jgi:diguanylate cyclase (GGDEF)-like protein
VVVKGVAVRPAGSAVNWTNRAQAALEAFLYGFGVYAIPAAIGLITLVAFATWTPQYQTAGATPANIRVLQQNTAALEPAQALQALRDAASVPFRDTHRSEAPFWFSFEASTSNSDEPVDIELPSRHAIEATCWDAGNLRRLGSASRVESSGRMKTVKAGFALRLGQVGSATRILCRSTFSGPARISVVQWPEDQLEASAQRFTRDAGVLEGGLLMLSAFVLVTALINREWLYVLFAAWLVAALRMAAISAGWDTNWFDRVVPADWIFLLRKLAAAVFYTLTVVLFSRLFADDLKRVGYSVLLRISQWSCPPLLLAAAVLPFAEWLPFLWLSTAFSIAVLVFLLVRILLVTRSRVAIWYSASLAITLSASLYEVVAAALGAKELIGSVNSVTAALSSSLMVALAIAEQMRHEHRERVKAEAELRDTYEAIPIGLFTLDRDGLFERVNPALAQMLGVDLSRGRREHWSDHFEHGAWRRLLDIAQRGAAQEMEIGGYPGESAESKRFLVKATLSADKVEGSLQDVTEKSKANERLRFLADHDPLTGVLNRRGIEGVLEQALGQLGASRPVALAYVDLDRFKLINDLFGHLAGDEVLRQVCRRIGELLAGDQRVGRVGGDEFVVVFENTSVDAAAAVCRQIIDRIETSSYQTGDKAFQVKGSIGLIELAEGVRVKDAIYMADRACRAAKKRSADGLVTYDKTAPEFGDRERELRLVEHLGAGTVPEGLFLVMQPIMSLSAPYQSHNFEVLLRMREADGSITPAGKIIEAAENNGRAAVIDRWVLLQTLEWLELHHARLPNTRFVCMNLSGASLNDEKFTHDAFAMLARHRRAAQRLCIEITESVALHDLETTRRFIDTVRGFGAKVALDDFGAGYTSFSYLKELPADAVKIDGSFVTAMNKHPANQAIVEAIVELARNLGMQSIAEWAEDRATVEALWRAGVDYVQGYAVSRPLSPAAILGAECSPSFIQDPDVAQFVRGALASARSLELWDPLDDPSSIGLH